MLSEQYGSEQLFAAVLGVRNLIPGPKFRMDYRRFHIGTACRLLEDAGFTVNVHEAPGLRSVVEAIRGH
ncbi:MAG: hypothetical protein ACKVPX_14070 [Myxococcaceae bacterium]